MTRNEHLLTRCMVVRALMPTVARAHEIVAGAPGSGYCGLAAGSGVAQRNLLFAGLVLSLKPASLGRVLP